MKLKREVAVVESKNLKTRAVDAVGFAVISAFTFFLSTAALTHSVTTFLVAMVVKFFYDKDIRRPSLPAVLNDGKVLAEVTGEIHLRHVLALLPVPKFDQHTFSPAGRCVRCWLTSVEIAYHGAEDFCSGALPYPPLKVDNTGPRS